MIDWLFALLLIFAFIMIILIINYHDDPFWGGMFTILDIVLWFILASSVLVIETAGYQYNNTTGVMEPALIPMTSTVAPEMVYFFYMMAIIMIIFFCGYFLFAPVYKLMTGKNLKDDWEERRNIKK